MQRPLLAIVLVAASIGFLSVCSQAKGALKKGQSVSESQVQGSPTDNYQSWFFVLEQETQWTLVVRTGNEDDTSISNVGDGPHSNEIHPISSGKTPSNTGKSKEAGDTPGKNLAVGNKLGGNNFNSEVDDDRGGSGSNVMVFEGNTNDLPLVDRQGKPIKPKVLNPSSPSS